MNEAFADNPSDSASRAADELRAAADNKEVKRAVSSNEEKAIALKEAAADKAAQIRDYAGEKATELKSAAASTAESLREGAEEAAINLRGAAVDEWQDTRIKMREAHTSMEEYVRKNPTRAVVGAAAAGFVFGILFHR